MREEEEEEAEEEEEVLPYAENLEEMFCDPEFMVFSEAFYLAEQLHPLVVASLIQDPRQPAIATKLGDILAMAEELREQRQGGE